MKHVWYVQGDPDYETYGGWHNLFETEECAEKYARLAFPDEDIHTRNARIFYREVLSVSYFKE
jgi:hypothetical protein